MATLRGRITDVTSRPPESISSITVKAPSVRIGEGLDIISTSPAGVDFDPDTGFITITDISGGLSWLYIEGDGWSDSIALAVADGMTTLIEAAANASGTPGLADFRRLVEAIDDVALTSVRTALANNSTTNVGFSGDAGKFLALSTGGRFFIADTAIVDPGNPVNKKYVDGNILDNATHIVGAQDHAGKFVKLNQSGKLNISTGSVVAGTDPANKSYVDSKTAEAVNAGIVAPPAADRAEDAATATQIDRTHVAADRTAVESAKEQVESYVYSQVSPDDATVLGLAATEGTETNSWLTNRFVSKEALGVIQATDYGVVADGATDATAVLNQLMVDVSAAGGGHIVLPAGEIRTTSDLVQQSNVWMSGAGRDVTIIKPERHGFYRNATAENPIFNFHLSDLTIDGANRTGSGGTHGRPTWKGYHGQYHRQCTWSNLAVRNTGQTGLGPDFNDDCLIFNVVTEDTGLENDGTLPSGNGIGIGAGGGQGNPPGTGPWPAESITVMGCNVKRAKRFGIMYEGGISPQAIKVIGCSVTECEAGFDISGGTGAIITGNNAYKNRGAGFHIGSATLDSSLAGRRGRVSNNYAYDNGGAGVQYEALIHSPAGHGFSITDNTVENNAGGGIEVSTAKSDLRGLDITGNYLFGNPGVAMRIKGDGWKLIGSKISGNHFYDNGMEDSVPKPVIGLGIDTDTCVVEGNSVYRRSNLRIDPFITLGWSTSQAGTHKYLAINGTYAPCSYLMEKNTAQTLTDAVMTSNITTDSAPATLNVKEVAANYTATGKEQLLILTAGAIVYLPANPAAGHTLTVKSTAQSESSLRTTDGSMVDGATGPRFVQPGETVEVVFTGSVWLTLASARASSSGTTVVEVTSNYTIKRDDDVVISNGASEIYLLADAGNGAIVRVKNVASGAVNLRTTDSSTIDGAAPPYVLDSQQSVELLRRSGDWITI